jgi:aryl-alcohol dehydrogenase-like predicted oxidoreductase
MPILGKTNLEVSPIGLGTVEIGLPYGIGVKTLPTAREAETILKTAIDLGITYIDTARGYGVAEERIGKSGISQAKGVVIGTKCAQFLEQGEDPTGQELERLIREDIETSLRNLRVDSLQLVQLHGGSEEQIKRGELVAIMQKLLDEGKVQHVGIATRGEKAALAAIKSNFFETIQTAYSILDQRMAPKVLPSAQKKNIGIICRSVLLKGALTSAAEKLPPELSALKENSKQATIIATEQETDLPSLATQFAISNPAISTILIGTTNPKHLETALNTVKKDPLPNDILQKLGKLAINNPSLIDPSLWPPIQ